MVVKKGSSVSLQCEAEGNPPPVVSWSKVNQAAVVGRGQLLELVQVRKQLQQLFGNLLSQL